MRTRDKGFSDYGFQPGEEKQLKDYCKNSNFREHDILLQSAISANPAIAADLYYSLSAGISFERLSSVKQIHLPKNDFYGYQRKCLSIFKNFLVFYGKWK